MFGGIMKAVLMAGGFGTRLRPITQNIPKPMVPLLNRPMMEHIVNLLKKHGIEDIVVLLFYQAEIIQEYFKDGKGFGVNIEYILPQEDYGTAGAVKLAEDFIDDTFIVISGDVLTDFDLKKAVEFHKEKKSKATILLTRVENPLPFGIVIFDSDNKITKFFEKPTWGEVFSDTINTGIYILEKEILKYIPSNKEFDFSKDLFPLLMKRKINLYGALMEGYWKDVGNLTEYRLAHQDVLEGKVHVDIPGNKVREGVYIGEQTEIDYTVNIEGSIVIGKNTKVGKNVKIKNSVIGNNCVIEDGVKIYNTVIWDKTYIGRNSNLQECIIGRESIINEGVHLAEGVVISDKCVIGKNATLKAGVKVWPLKVVEDGATLASSLVWGEKWSKSIFGPYGVNGIANFEITPEFAAKLGAAYGATFKKGSIIATSRDHHPASRMINRAFMTGVLSTGVHVHDYGVVPIPVVRYLASQGNEAGGVHIRRSPFDPEFIDMKFYEEKGIDIHSSKEKTVERFFFGEDFRRVTINETGEISFPTHAIEKYVEGFLNKINVDKIKKRRFKIVIDFSHGSSASLFHNLIGKMDCEVIALNGNLDSTKLTKTAEEFNNAINQLSNIVISLKSDIGFYLDAGAEKIYIIDHKGEIYDGATALCVVTKLFLDTFYPKRIAVPVNASMIIEMLAEKKGVQVIRTKTTSRALMETAMMYDVGFVGENYGGYIFTEFLPAFDGMFSIVKILEMLSMLELSLHDVLRHIPKSYLLTANIPCSWEKKGTVMRHLVEKTSDKDVELIDGIKVYEKEGWYLALPSQDKAYFTVFSESLEKKKAQEYLEFISSLVREVAK
jgi:mannose-1-phosphate guanylyltransferase/phosphomannomutase